MQPLMKSSADRRLDRIVVLGECVRSVVVDERDFDAHFVALDLGNEIAQEGYRTILSWRIRSTKTELDNRKKISKIVFLVTA